MDCVSFLLLPKENQVTIGQMLKVKKKNKKLKSFLYACGLNMAHISECLVIGAWHFLKGITMCGLVGVGVSLWEMLLRFVV